MAKKKDAHTKLNRRVAKARRAVRAGFVTKGEDGLYRMPSLTQLGRHYVVKLQPLGNHVVRASCWGEDALGQGPCLGNSNGHVCWHVLAAILSGGKKVRFYTTERGARRAGTPWLIRSGNGKGRIWVIINEG